MGQQQVLVVIILTAAVLFLSFHKPKKAFAQEVSPQAALAETGGGVVSANQEEKQVDDVAELDQPDGSEELEASIPLDENQKAEVSGEEARERSATELEGEQESVGFAAATSRRKKKSLVGLQLHNGASRANSHVSDRFITDPAVARGENAVVTAGALLGDMIVEGQTEVPEHEGEDEVSGEAKVLDVDRDAEVFQAVQKVVSPAVEAVVESRVVEASAERTPMRGGVHAMQADANIAELEVMGGAEATEGAEQADVSQPDGTLLTEAMSFGDHSAGEITAASVSEVDAEGESAETEVFEESPAAEGLSVQQNFVAIAIPQQTGIPVEQQDVKENVSEHTNFDADSGEGGEEVDEQFVGDTPSGEELEAINAGRSAPATVSERSFFSSRLSGSAAAPMAEAASDGAAAALNLEDAAEEMAEETDALNLASELQSGNAMPFRAGLEGESHFSEAVELETVLENSSSPQPEEEEVTGVGEDEESIQADQPYDAVSSQDSVIFVDSQMNEKERQEGGELLLDGAVTRNTMPAEVDHSIDRTARLKGEEATLATALLAGEAEEQWQETLDRQPESSTVDGVQAAEPSAMDVPSAAEVATELDNDAWEIFADVLSPGHVQLPPPTVDDRVRIHVVDDPTEETIAEEAVQDFAATFLAIDRNQGGAERAVVFDGASATAEKDNQTIGNQNSGVAKETNQESVSHEEKVQETAPGQAAQPRLEDAPSEKEDLEQNQEEGKKQRQEGIRALPEKQINTQTDVKEWVSAAVQDSDSSVNQNKPADDVEGITESTLIPSGAMRTRPSLLAVLLVAASAILGLL